MQSHGALLAKLFLLVHDTMYIKGWGGGKITVAVKSLKNAADI